MKNVLLIYGGKSVEHDISVITALQTMENMPKTFNMIPLYIKTDGKIVTADNLTDKNIYLDYEGCVKGEKEISFGLGKSEILIIKNGKIKKIMPVDCAILCNHGHGGEDGSLQGLLEMSQIPYTSCSVASSAVCMDKALTKIILENADILTASYVHFGISEFEANEDEIIDKILKEIKFPCIVKPAKLGSSVGINICENENMLKDKIDEAFLFDDKIIVEKFVENAREFCCAVISCQDELFESKVTEVKKERMFTFEEKYLKEKPKGESEISHSLEKRIKSLAKKTYFKLGCMGVVRVDFLYDEKTDNLFVNEVNTIPGSLAFNMFETSFGDLINILIAEALRRKEKEGELVYKFSSSAIEGYIKTANSLKIK